MYFRLIGIPLRLEVSLDPVAQEEADVLVQEVAGSVTPGLIPFDEVLAGPLGDDDERMALAEDPPLERGEEAAFPVEAEGDLGDQHEVGVLAGQRGAGGDEARVPAHQLHQADAVGGAPCLDVGPAQHLLGLLEGGVVAERGEDELDVVVDRLGDADDRLVQPAARDLLARSPWCPAGSRRRRRRRGCRSSRVPGCPPSRPAPGARASCPAPSRPGSGCARGTPG